MHVQCSKQESFNIHYLRNFRKGEQEQKENNKLLNLEERTIKHALQEKSIFAMGIC